MNQEILQAIASFMSRAQLQAGEIEAYQACQKALQEAFEAAAPVDTGGHSEAAEEG
jgi:hypothetical protein